MSGCDCHGGDVDFSATSVPRRVFLKQMVAGGLAVAGSSMLGSSKSAAAVAPEKTLPTVPLGGKAVTRLVAGYNPIGGHSHSTRKLAEHMRSYFTVGRTTDFLLHCEGQGINTWQGDYTEKVRDALRAARDRGSKMQWICLTSERHNNLKEALALKPIAVVHHGGVTDRMFHDGEPGKVHDFVKKVHDAGVLAGVSTHNPDHLAKVEGAGWENEFYMACFYNITRPVEEIQEMLGDRVLGELYLASDPLKMTERIRQVRKPCLAFKILAAGRLCKTKVSVERAFAYAYASIKSTDALIVGMYPVFSDEVQEDADLGRKYATLS
jgi:hypothetical protein